MSCRSRGFPKPYDSRFTARIPLPREITKVKTVHGDNKKQILSRSIRYQVRITDT